MPQNKKKIFQGILSENKEDADINAIVEAAWPVAEKWQKEKDQKRLIELTQNAGAEDFETDFTAIWKAIIEGKGRTLYVKEGFIQPAKLENNTVKITSVDNANVDDIIDEMIEKNRELGGDTVFVSGDELKEYNDLVLLKRFQ